MLIVCTACSAMYFGIFPNRRQFVNLSLFLLFCSLSFWIKIWWRALYWGKKKTHNCPLYLKQCCLFCSEIFCILKFIFVKRLNWAKRIQTPIKCTFYSICNAQSIYSPLFYYCKSLHSITLKNSVKNHLTPFFILLYQGSKPSFQELFPTDLTQNPHKLIKAFPKIFLTVRLGFIASLISIRKKNNN